MAILYTSVDCCASWPHVLTDSYWADTSVKRGNCHQETEQIGLVTALDFFSAERHPRRTTAHAQCQAVLLGKHHYAKQELTQICRHRPGKQAESESQLSAEGRARFTHGRRFDSLRNDRLTQQSVFAANHARRKKSKNQSRSCQQPLLRARSQTSAADYRVLPGMPKPKDPGKFFWLCHSFKSFNTPLHQCDRIYPCSGCVKRGEQG